VKAATVIISIYQHSSFTMASGFGFAVINIINSDL